LVVIDEPRLEASRRALEEIIDGRAEIKGRKDLIGLQAGQQLPPLLLVQVRHETDLVQKTPLA